MKTSNSTPRVSKEINDQNSSRAPLVYSIVNERGVWDLLHMQLTLPYVSWVCHVILIGLSDQKTRRVLWGPLTFSNFNDPRGGGYGIHRSVCSGSKIRWKFTLTIKFKASFYLYSLWVREIFIYHWTSL